MKRKQKTWVEEFNLDAKTVTIARRRFVDRFEVWDAEFGDIDPTYASVNQKARVQMELDAVVLDNDFKTGDNVNIANVMTRDDLKSTQRRVDFQLKYRMNTVRAMV